MSIPALILLLAQWQHERPFAAPICDAEAILRETVESGADTTGKQDTGELMNPMPPRNRFRRCDFACGRRGGVNPFVDYLAPFRIAHSVRVPRMKSVLSAIAGVVSTASPIAFNANCSYFAPG